MSAGYVINYTYLHMAIVYQGHYDVSWCGKVLGWNKVERTSVCEMMVQHLRLHQPCRIKDLFFLEAGEPYGALQLRHSTVWMAPMACAHEGSVDLVLSTESGFTWSSWCSISWRSLKLLQAWWTSLYHEGDLSHHLPSTKNVKLYF